MTLVGLCGCCRSRQGIPQKKVKPSTIFPQSHWHDWGRLFLCRTAVRLTLFTPLLLPELCSLVIILLLWVLFCVYKLPHLLLPYGQEEVTRDYGSQPHLLVYVTFSVPSCGNYCWLHNYCQRLLREMNKTNVHRPKDSLVAGCIRDSWLLEKMSIICSWPIWHRFSHSNTEIQMLK